MALASETLRGDAPVALAAWARDLPGTLVAILPPVFFGRPGDAPPTAFCRSFASASSIGSIPAATIAFWPARKRLVANRANVPGVRAAEPVSEDRGPPASTLARVCVSISVGGMEPDSSLSLTR